MAFPDGGGLDRALLQRLANQEVHEDDDIVAELAKGFDLTTAELAERLKNGRSKFGNLIDFAKGRLKLQGLIHRVGAKRYQITSAGLEELSRWGTQIPEPEGQETAEPSEIGDGIDGERELKEALRDNLEQLEEGLKFVEVERYVKFGFIDIVAQDKSGTTVVIELKKGEADHHAVGQVASYMGALLEDGVPVRGMLIAYSFSHRGVAAASVVRDLELHRYGHHFRFERVAQRSGS